jgi:ERO1-like protein alpha
VLYPLLSQLTELPFFRYFKVNLYCDCPFWCVAPLRMQSAPKELTRSALLRRPDDGMCALPDCSVCECPADEVPLPWRTQAPEVVAAAAAPAAASGDGAECAGGAAGEAAEAMVNAREGVVNRTLDVGAEFRAWRELDNPWTADDEAGSDAAYVNLALNPERYTGYTGDHARRVWSAVYSQPCFDGVANGTCGARPEVRMFYRLISGTHASITAHIAADYLLDGGRGVWGRNHALWLERLGSHRDWQENLYFTALFVLRALLKAGDFLLAADYRTGSPRRVPAACSLLFCAKKADTPRAATMCSRRL